MILRSNLPVTQRELTFAAEQRLISATDVQGNLTYCNDEFVTVSGFRREQLIGSVEARSGVEQVISTQGALDGINGAVERIHQMSQQMAAASEQQAHVAEEISRQISSIARVSDQNADIAVSSSTVGDDLKHTAQQLNALVARFNS